MIQLNLTFEQACVVRDSLTFYAARESDARGGLRTTRSSLWHKEEAERAEDIRTALTGLIRES